MAAAGCAHLRLVLPACADRSLYGRLSNQQLKIANLEVVSLRGRNERNGNGPVAIAADGLS
jgi:hypothetical protein